MIAVMFVKLGGLALVVLAALTATVVLHGSTSSTSATSERRAINRAVNVPFIDYEHRDARAVCEDFTPAVASRFGQNVSHAPTCEARVVDALRRSGRGLAYSSSKQPLTPLPVVEIRWRGKHATIYFSRHSNHVDLRLEKIAGRWQISTPAGLSPSCNYVGGHTSCIEALWIGSGPA